MFTYTHTHTLDKTNKQKTQIIADIMAPKVGVKRCLQNFQTRSVSYDSKQGKGHSWSGNKPEKVQI